MMSYKQLFITEETVYHTSSHHSSHLVQESYNMAKKKSHLVKASINLVQQQKRDQENYL